MALELCAYHMSKNGRRLPIIRRNFKPENVSFGDNAVKVLPSGMTPAAHHVYLSRWVGTRSPGAQAPRPLRTRSLALFSTHEVTRDTG